MMKKKGVMMMKKTVLSLMLAAALALGIAMPALAANTVPVYVNDNLLAEQAVVKNNTAYLPMRAIYEAVYASVNWDGKTKTVTAQQFLQGEKSTQTVLPVNGKSATLTAVGGAEMKVDYAGRQPFTQKGRVYLPVRLASELMGYEVTYTKGRVDIKERYLVNGTPETGICRLDLRTGEVSQLAADGQPRTLGKAQLKSLENPSSWHEPYWFEISQTPNGNYLVKAQGMGSGALSFSYDMYAWLPKAGGEAVTCHAHLLAGELPQPLWQGDEVLIPCNEAVVRVNDKTGQVTRYPAEDIYSVEYGGNALCYWWDGRYMLLSADSEPYLYDTQTKKMTYMPDVLLTPEIKAQVKADMQALNNWSEYDDEHYWEGMGNLLSLDNCPYMTFDRAEGGVLYFTLHCQYYDFTTSTASRTSKDYTLTYTLPQ